MYLYLSSSYGKQRVMQKRWLLYSYLLGETEQIMKGSQGEYLDQNEQCTG